MQKKVLVGLAVATVFSAAAGAFADSVSTTTVNTFEGIGPGGSSDDLTNRRNDLIARVMFEREHGNISKSQSDSLLNQINNIDQRRSSLMPNRSVAYRKQIGQVYKSYDKCATELKRMSGESAKQLAGKYSFWAL